MPFVQTMPSVIKGVDRLNAGPIRKMHATGIKTPPERVGAGGGHGFAGRVSVTQSALAMAINWAPSVT